MRLHGGKSIFEPTMIKMCHEHNSKGSYKKNSILLGILKKDKGNDTTYAKGLLRVRIHYRVLTICGGTRNFP